MSGLVLVLPTGLEDDKDLQFLINGGDLLKVRSGSWKKTRYYKLQEDCKTIWHESKKTLKSKNTCESQKGYAQGRVRNLSALSLHALSCPALTFVVLFWLVCVVINVSHRSYYRISLLKSTFLSISWVKLL